MMLRKLYLLNMKCPMFPLAIRCWAVPWASILAAMVPIFLLSNILPKLMLLVFTWACSCLPFCDRSSSTFPTSVRRIPFAAIIFVEAVLFLLTLLPVMFLPWAMP